MILRNAMILLCVLYGVWLTATGLRDGLSVPRSLTWGLGFFLLAWVYARVTQR
jgi:hypothetical protein